MILTRRPAWRDPDMITHTTEMAQATRRNPAGPLIYFRLLHEMLFHLNSLFLFKIVIRLQIRKKRSYSLFYVKYYIIEEAKLAQSGVSLPRKQKIRAQVSIIAKFGYNSTITPLPPYMYIYI